MEKLLIIPPIFFTGYSVGVYATLHNGGGFEFGAARFLRVNGVLMKLSANAVHEHENVLCIS